MVSLAIVAHRVSWHRCTSFVETPPGVVAAVLPVDRSRLPAHRSFPGHRYRNPVKHEDSLLYDQRLMRSLQ